MPGSRACWFIPQDWHGQRQVNRRPRISDDEPLVIETTWVDRSRSGQREQPDEQHRNSRKALQDPDATGSASHSLLVAYLGESYLLAGRIEDALAAAGRALALSREHSERGHQAYALRLLGEIASRREPPDDEQTEAHYQEALALAEELGMRPLGAQCHLGLGKLYRRIGRLDEARADLATAVAMLREMEMPLWLPEAEAELAEVIASPSVKQVR